MKRKGSIVFKLSLFISVMLALLVILTSLIVITISRGVLDSNVRDFLISTVEQDVSTIRITETEENRTEHVYYPYGDGYIEIDTDFLKTVGNVYAAIYTGDGDFVYGELPVYMDEPFTDTYTYVYSHDGIRFQVYDRRIPVVGARHGELWIRGVVSNQQSEAQLGKIISVMLLFVPVLAVVAMAGGYFLMQRLLKPLKEIQETAGQIASAKDLRKRIDIQRDDEIGKLSGSLNTMMDRLQESFENEKRFTSDVSHELRTPLSVILGESEYMLEKEREKEEYAEALEVIQRQGRKMDTIVSDMLSFSRMDQGIENYCFEKTDLSSLVRDVVTECGKWDRKGIQLSSDIEDDIYVSGNAFLLERMTRNLIDNAYKYGNENGHVDVRLVTENGYARLSVEDDGIGISEEDRDKIFLRFYRADASRTEEGTGLGLSMVSRIAELHDARIELQSEEGKGSCFSIIIKII